MINMPYPKRINFLKEIFEKYGFFMAMEAVLFEDPVKRKEVDQISIDYQKIMPLVLDSETLALEQACSDLLIRRKTRGIGNTELDKKDIVTLETYTDKVKRLSKDGSRFPNKFDVFISDFFNHFPVSDREAKSQLAVSVLLTHLSWIHSKNYVCCD
jgi:hypothetical protein